MAINPHIYANPGYDPLTDLAPITRLGVGPQVLVVHKSVPANSLAELVSLAKAKPGELSFNSPGVGTPGHLASSLLMHLTGIRATHIPYKSGGQAALDVVGGHVTWTIDGPTVLKPFIQDGRLRPLAVTTARRAKSMPDVPTMAEAGVPGYDFTAWAGIAAPAGTPQPVIGRLYAEMAKILATPDAVQWFESFAAEPGGESPKPLPLWCAPKTPSSAKSFAPWQSRPSRPRCRGNPADEATLAARAVSARGGFMKIVIIGLALSAALTACSFKSERTVQNPPAATTTTTVPATATTTVTTPAPAASTTVYTR